MEEQSKFMEEQSLWLVPPLANVEQEEVEQQEVDKLLLNFLLNLILLS